MEKKDCCKNIAYMLSLSLLEKSENNFTENLYYKMFNRCIVLKNLGPKFKNNCKMYENAILKNKLE